MVAVTPNEILTRYQQGDMNFSGLDLSQTNLSSTSLRGADFSKCDLNNANFDGADLTGAKFNEANLERASFVGSILKGADFSGANMGWAVLRSSFLEDTNFSNSNLQWAHLCRDDLSRCNLNGANLTWSCLVDANMSQDQFGAIPNKVMQTVRRVEEDPVSIKREDDTVLGAGYKIENPGQALGAGYKPVSAGGAASGYRGLVSHEETGYQTARPGFDPLKKKQEGASC